MPRQFSRHIDPIPEYEPDCLSNTLPALIRSTGNSRRSPSPPEVTHAAPSSNATKSSAKRSSNSMAPVATRPDDFVLIPEHVTTEKGLPAGNHPSRTPFASPSSIVLGNHTSFAQLSREKRLVKEPQRTLSEGVLYVASLSRSNADECPLRSRSTKDSSSVRPDNLALTAIENTATMKDARASGVTHPIPVPSQIHNFEKMQGSRDRTKSLGGNPATSPTGSPYDGTIVVIVSHVLYAHRLLSRSSHICGSPSSSQSRFIQFGSGQFD